VSAFFTSSENHAEAQGEGERQREEEAREWKELEFKEFETCVTEEKEQGRDNLVGLEKQFCDQQHGTNTGLKTHFQLPQKKRF
jgi:hypothetical protein